MTILLLSAMFCITFLISTTIETLEKEFLISTAIQTLEKDFFDIHSNRDMWRGGVSKIKFESVQISSVATGEVLHYYCEYWD